MTKEQLRKYRPLTHEKTKIEQRLRSLERRPDSEAELIEPLRAFYHKKLAELVALQLDIEHAIETLEPIEREIVRLRYIDGLEWHQICAEINYEWTQTHRIHARVLRKLEKL